MPRGPIPGFIGPSYQLRSVNADCQRSVNWYPERVESGTGKAAWVLQPTPGMKLFAQSGETQTGCRGLYTTSSGRLFGVFYQSLYEFAADGTKTFRGSLTSSSGFVRMADNGATGNQLIVVDGASGYLLNLGTNAFTTISDVNFPVGATHVTFIDGYFIVNKPNTGYFYFSQSYDGSNWTPAAFANAEGNPDNLQALIANGRELWLPGDKTVEVWNNVGAGSPPFQRIPGAFQEIGITAKYSLAQMNNSVFWLGGDRTGYGMVWRSQGLQATRISTHAVEQAIQQYTVISDAEAFCYQQDGHYFYELTFPTANVTWVYDNTTEVWHERNWFNSIDSTFNRHRAQCQAFAFGKNLVGDYASSNLYELSPTTYTDVGDPIVRDRISPHLAMSRNRTFFKQLRLDMDVGEGLDSGQGSDPVIHLRWSDDAGHTWSNGISASLGKTGDYGAFINWQRLGVARDRVWWVRMSDPVKTCLISAEVEMEEGIH